MPIFFEVIFPVVVLIAIGYGAAVAGRFPASAVRALSDVTFLIFMPALLFGALARVNFDSLTPGAALAYYAAGLPLYGMVLLAQRWRGVPTDLATMRALGSVFSNNGMLGIPLVRVAFGEEGLALLLTIIALHSLTFLTLSTMLIELSAGPGAGPAGESASGPRAGESRSHRKLAMQLALVVRNSLVHPVVLPILVGLAFSATGLKLPRPLELPLGMLAGAATPLCLVLLGASLAQFDLRNGLRGAASLAAMKNFVHPLVAWTIGRWLLELPPLPLAVATLTASLPIGANVYLFAQRYRVGAEQTSAGVTLSTLVAAASLPVLLLLLPGR